MLDDQLFATHQLKFRTRTLQELLEVSTFCVFTYALSYFLYQSVALFFTYDVSTVPVRAPCCGVLQQLILVCMLVSVLLWLISQS